MKRLNLGTWLTLIASVTVNGVFADLEYLFLVRTVVYSLSTLAPTHSHNSATFLSN